MERAQIIIAPHTEAYVHIWTAEDIEKEISQEFSFIPPNAEFKKTKLKAKYWDTRIRLFNRVSKTFPKGLVPRLVEWATARAYSLQNRVGEAQVGWEVSQTTQLVNAFPTPFPARDYQLTAVTECLQRQRAILLSPTASGKSLILYYLVRARMAYGPILVIVPNISLVAQLIQDWKEYGWADVESSVAAITKGQNRDTEKPVVVSTWQSIFRLPQEWFERYTSVLGDECHLYTAKSLQGILEKLVRCPFRVGTTGTLEHTNAHVLSLEGVFGPPVRVASTADLQERGFLTPIQIQSHVLQHDLATRHIVFRDRTYQGELETLIPLPARQAWLAAFVPQLPGNVLVLFHWVDRQGIPLFHAIRDHVQNTRPVYFISGKIEGEQRDRIRKLLEETDHVVLTFGTQTIRCAASEMIPLSDGTSMMAKEITVHHDVADEWVLNTIEDIPVVSTD